MDFLVKCTPKLGVENTLDWLPTVAWDAVNGMINLEEFRSFAQNLEKDAPNRFKDWYNTLNPEKEKLPLDWKKLDQLPFKKLLVLRCLRPDRITIALSNFIRQVLPEGDSFLDMDSKLSFTDVLESAINDAESANPVFIILSPGADPVKEVEKIAKKRGIERGKTMFIISLG
jgi:dynein heavy chain